MPALTETIRFARQLNGFCRILTALVMPFAEQSQMKKFVLVPDD